MKQSCDYHPTTTAHWYCPNCSVKLCPECVVKRDRGGLQQGETLHLCPKCNVEVEFIGVCNIIEPFWKRLPKIFAYPFYSVSPLALIVVLSVLTVVLSGPGLLKMLARGAIFLMVLKYSFEALKSTAGGDLRPPKIESKSVSDDMGKVLKQFVLFALVFASIMGVSGILNPLVGIVYMLAALFFIPSMIILLVTTGSLFHAINPLVFVRLTYRIGWGYLLMYLFLVLLGSAPAIAAQFVENLLPAGLHDVFANIAQNYYTIISYHLMGYVILQYHEEVGYKVAHDDFRDGSTDVKEHSETDPGDPILKEIYPLIQDGNYEDAIAVVDKMTHGAEISSLELSKRYYSLLKLTEKTPAMLAHAVVHLELAAKANRKDEVVEVLSECRKLNAEFQPTAYTLFKVGGWKGEKGRWKEAVGWYNKLIKTYPQHPLVPKSYFRAAQIFNDRLLDPEKARRVLLGLKKKFPDHEIIQQVDNYLASM